MILLHCTVIADDVWKINKRVLWKRILLFMNTNILQACEIGESGSYSTIYLFFASSVQNTIYYISLNISLGNYWFETKVMTWEIIKAGIYYSRLRNHIFQFWNVMNTMFDGMFDLPKSYLTHIDLGLTLSNKSSHKAWCSDNVTSHLRYLYTG